MGRFPPMIIPEDEVLGALKDAQGNQRRAAEQLGVTQGWIAKYLKKNGYVQHISWVKEEGNRQ